MRFHADLIIIVIFFLSQQVMSITTKGTLFHKITINSERLTPSTILDSYNTNRESGCASFCNMNVLCNVFCVVNGICQATSISVTNKFVELYVTDPITCYTSLLSTSGNSDETTFSMVSLNKVWLVSVNLTKSESPFLTNSGCVDVCKSSTNCTAVCIYNNKCISTDMIVAPGYTDDDVVDPITCYTILKPDLLFGVPSFNSDPQNNRGAEYLTKGIHNRDKSETCLKLYNVTGPWMYFDFEEQVSISKMVVTTQVRKADNIYWIPYNTTVYAGNTDPQDTDLFATSDDFTNVFRFPGSGLEEQTTYTYSLNVSNKRYLGFKREVYGSFDRYFMICYLELYT